jgi:hypothetical protein
VEVFFELGTFLEASRMGIFNLYDVDEENGERSKEQDSR